MRIHRFAVALSALALGAGMVRAEYLSYTITGTADGSLGSRAFTGAAFTLTAIGDTTQIQQLSSGAYMLSALRMSIDVAGVGTGTFVDPTEVQAFSSLGVTENIAFLDSDYTNPIVGINPTGLLGYNLSTPVAPTAAMLSSHNVDYWDTTAGTLGFIGTTDFSNPRDLSFQVGQATLPEPSTLVLAAIAAMAGLCALARRRCLSDRDRALASHVPS
jgi:hypothetical protein